MAEMAPPSASSSPVKQITPPHSHLEIPDDEVQRGRKRRRSSNNSPPPHLTSNGSTTQRGRVRRRSASFTLSDDFERIRDSSPGNGNRRSPGRKYVKKEFVFVSEKKRSQSLSRSRTRGVGNGATGEGREETVRPRRRQRTHSRSRKHGHEDCSAEGKENRRDSAVEIEESAVED